MGAILTLFGYVNASFIGDNFLGACVDDAEKQALYRIAKKLVDEQNLVLGVIAGVVAALAGALAWGAIVMKTGNVYGWIAIVLGLFVGWGVQVFGRGIDRRLPFIAGILAVISCLLGNMAALLIFTLLMEGAPLASVFDIMSTEELFRMTKATLGYVDLVFWALAAGAAAQVAKRHLTDEEQLAISLYQTQLPQEGPISPG